MPEINFGKVKGEPFRYEDFTPEQLEGLRGYQGVRGTKWYSGNKINGTLTTENVFSNSGIKDAMIDDHYVNTENGEVYICTLGGDSNTAKWKFIDRLLITDQSLTKQNIPADAKSVGNEIATYDTVKELTSIGHQSNSYIPKYDDVVYCETDMLKRGCFVAVGKSTGKVGYLHSPSEQSSADWVHYNITNKVTNKDSSVEVNPHILVLTDNSIVAIGNYENIGDGSTEKEMFTAFWFDTIEGENYLLGNKLYSAVPKTIKDISIHKAIHCKGYVVGVGKNLNGNTIIASVKIPEMECNIAEFEDSNLIDSVVTDMIILPNEKLLIATENKCYITYRELNPVLFDNMIVSGKYSLNELNSISKLSSLCLCGSRCYAMHSSQRTLYYTDNGTKWFTTGSEKSIDGSVDTKINDIIYTNDGCFIAVGSGIYRSDTDLNWTQIETNHDFKSICFGHINVIAVGHATDSEYGVVSRGIKKIEKSNINQMIYKAKSETKTVSKKVDDLNKKTDAYIPLASITNFERSNAYMNPTNATQLLNCDGTLIALCGREIYISNDDGESWEVRNYMSSGSYLSFKSIAYGNGKYVLVDSKNKVYETSDLNVDTSTWKVTSNFASGSNTPTCVAFGNNEFVLFLKNNNPAISVDGSGWQHTSSSISDFNIVKAIYVKEEWILISSDGATIFNVKENNFASATKKTVSQINSNFASISDIIYVEKLDKIYACGSNSTATSGGFGVIASSKDVMSNFDIEFVDSALNKIISIVYEDNVLVAIGCDSSTTGNSSYVCIGTNGWKKLDGDLKFNGYKFKYVVFGKERFVSVGDGYTRYSKFDKKEVVLNDVTSNMLLNENKESFNFGYLNGERGFYTGMERTPESFLPFIQNVPRIVAEGEIEIAATSDPATFIPIEKGSTYLFTITDITKSNGAIRGYRTYVVYTSETVGTGVGILTKVSLASGGTSQLSITDIKEYLI